jgi:cysteine synthase
MTANPFDPDSFEAQVLQRLTAVETELKLMRRNGWLSGGAGGTVVAALFLIARLMGWL